jgi:hypothetical protein
MVAAASGARRKEGKAGRKLRCTGILSQQQQKIQTARTTYKNLLQRNRKVK